MCSCFSGGGGGGEGNCLGNRDVDVGVRVVVDAVGRCLGHVSAAAGCRITASGNKQCC